MNIDQETKFKILHIMKKIGDEMDKQVEAHQNIKALVSDIWDLIRGTEEGT